MKLPDIKQTCDRFVRRQSPEIRGFFKKYFRTLERKFRKYRKRQYPWTKMPSWRLLPSMLAEGYRHNSGRARLPKGFLRDVRWGQYCLYLFIRFQDDLFDGQSSCPV
jgi:hypothetical protein